MMGYLDFYGFFTESVENSFISSNTVLVSAQDEKRVIIMRITNSTIAAFFMASSLPSSDQYAGSD